ncbi:nucleotidyltransferase domain-containing protein [Heliomicrobium undosum]|nr:nucleotidyltransferase domain-containing protein [Heliomicrobium undosum]
MEIIIGALQRIDVIEGAAIFGSRSMGNFKHGSDVDIAVYGAHISEQVVQELNADLNERLPLPYYFDVIHYEGVTHQGLKEHIDRYGRQFYTRPLPRPKEICLETLR